MSSVPSRDAISVDSSTAEQRRLIVRELGDVRDLASKHNAVFLDLSILTEEQLLDPNIVELIELFENKIRGVEIGMNITFTNFNLQYQNLMNHLVFIEIHQQMAEQDFNVLKEWLYDAREDGSAKFVELSRLDNREFIETIREDFLIADQKTSFSIKLQSANFNTDDFWCNEVNSITNERLIIEHSYIPGEWFITRQSENCANSAEGTFESINDPILHLPHFRIYLPVGSSEPIIQDITVPEDITLDDEDLLTDSESSAQTDTGELEQKQNKYCNCSLL